GLAAQVVYRLQVCRFLRDETVGGDEVRDREPNLLLPFGIVGGRAAFEVDGAIRDQRNAGSRGDRIELDLQLVELELALHRVDDPVAEIHRIADDLLLVVVIGERHGRFAMSQRDRAGVLDLLERAGEFLGERRSGGQRCRRKRRKQGYAQHWNPPLWLAYPIASGEF